MAPVETLLDVDIWQRSRIPVCARVSVAAGSNLSTAIRRFPGRCGPAASNRRHMITRSCSKLVRGGRSATLLGIIDSSSGIAARAFAPVQSAIAQESVSSIWPPTVVPMVKADTDTSAVQVGVEFVAATNGWLTAIESISSLRTRGGMSGLCGAHRRSVSKSLFRGNSIEGRRSAILPHLRAPRPGGSTPRLGGSTLPPISSQMVVMPVTRVRSPLAARERTGVTLLGAVRIPTAEGVPK